MFLTKEFYMKISKCKIPCFYKHASFQRSVTKDTLNHIFQNKKHAIELYYRINIALFSTSSELHPVDGEPYITH